MAQEAKIVITAEDQTREAFGAVLNNLSAVKSAAASMGIALSAVGMVEFVRHSIEMEDELSKLSEKTGTAVETLAGLKYASESVGLSLESVAKAAKKLSGNIADNPDLFAKFGVTAKDTTGALVQLADIFQTMPDGINKTALAVKLLGKSGEEMIPFLNQGGSALQLMIDKGKQFNPVTAESAQQAALFNDSLDALKASGGALGINLANSLLPTLTKIITAIKDTSEESGKLKGLWVGLGAVGTALFTDDMLTRDEQIAKRRAQIQDEISTQNFLFVDREKSDGYKKLLAEDARLAQEQASLQKEKNIAEERKKFREQMSAMNIAPAQSKVYELAKFGASDAEVNTAQERVNKSGTGGQLLNSLGGKSATDEYDKLIAKLQGGVITATAEAESAQNNYNKSQQEALKLFASPEWGKLNSNQRANAAAFLQQAINQDIATKAIQDNIKAEKEQADAVNKQTVAIYDEAYAINNKAAALELENQSLGKTKAQMNALELAQMDADIADKKRMADGIRGIEGYQGITLALDNQVAALLRLRNAKAESGKYDQSVLGIFANPANQAKAYSDTIKGLMDGTITSWRSMLNSLGNSFKTQVMDYLAKEAQKAAMEQMGANANMYVAVVMAAITASGVMNQWQKNSQAANVSLNGGNAGVSGTSSQLWERDAGWFAQKEFEWRSLNLTARATESYNLVMKESAKTIGDAGALLGYTGAQTQSYSVAITTNGDVTAALAKSISGQLTPAIVLFQREGENLAQTAKRLTDTFKATNDFINALGVSSGNAFGGFGLASAQSRDALVTAAGGLSSFSSQAKTFTDNFLTPVQKLAPAYDDVARVFNKLGIEGITTNKQFADLVKAQMNIGNTSVVAQLLSVADSFNTITKSAQDANGQINALLNKDRFATMVDYARAQAALNGANSIPSAMLKAAQTSALESSGTATFAATNQNAISVAAAQNVNAIAQIQDMPSLFQSLMQALKDLLGQLGAAISKALSDIWLAIRDGLSGSVSSLWKTLTDFVSQLWPAFTHLTSSIWSTFTSLASSLWSILTNIFQNIWNVIANLPGQIWNVLSQLPAQIWNILIQLPGLIWNALASIPGAIASAISNAIGSLNPLKGGGIGNIISGATNIISGAINTVSSWFSDPRLKENVRQVGNYANGLGMYEFNYIGDSTKARYQGVMSDEVRRVMPSAVSVGADGYDRVNYAALGLRMEKLPSFAVGSNYLPNDMIAKVHKGEEITPAPFVDIQRAARDRGNELLEKVLTAIEKLRAENQSGQIAIAGNTQDTYKIIKRWEGGGMPAVRTV